MKEKSAMEQGWDFAAHLAGVDFAANAGYDYVSKVAEAIKQVEDNINNHPYRGQDIAHFKGYVAEEWHAATFNVDAVARGSDDRATVLHSNAADSVDIELGSGDKYSAKVYSDGEKSAVAQAKLNPDTHKAAYKDQYRLVPHDQLDDAKIKAHREMLRNAETRPEVSEANKETEKMLTDVVKNDEGVKSIAKDRSDFEDMAKDAKKQEFKAEDQDLTTDSAIKSEYMLKQALQAGITAATITVAMQMAPEIYKTIAYLIKHGEINIQQVQHMGTKAISSGAEGFLRGSVSCTLMIMCEKGAFGEAMKAISPTALGIAVSIVMGTVKNSILVAAGKMTAQQMGSAFVDSVIVSAGFYAGMVAGEAIMSTEVGASIGAVIGQLFGFQIPVVGYLLGSLIGCAFASAYNIGKKKLISFCVDTGFTCFGLVEQDYELPDEILNDMGIATIQIPTVDVARTDVNRTDISVGVDKNEYETIDIKMLRRGVIGVNKIGYIF
ncbi:hypothetical protein [Butyrivibrio sp. AC2005]|uniref:hypothetical protein n=1 Tax=Butyrivibrio sp. AC2005 TaxID=1280672 RepID=UPI0003FE9F82|nr:hypothetical protein [Butyrivibrio sp. AC2005]